MEISHVLEVTPSTATLVRNNKKRKTKQTSQVYPMIEFKETGFCLYILKYIYIYYTNP